MSPAWMKSRVLVSRQVEEFIKARAPEPRSRLTRAVKNLTRGHGDIKALDGPLSGYSRLRVGGYRVIFAERFEDGERHIECVFSEARGVVYELFEKLAVCEVADR
jgi:mRNA-degrading endonuclease RelE of RelBE toxin-antitoxin system